MSDVLILNADARPISFLPMSTEIWQDTMIRLYKEEAEVLHTYDDWVVHSPGKTWQVPSVVILKEQVKQRRMWVARDNTAQKNLVFLRDCYMCQYCGDQFPRKVLTWDHVKPRVNGGRTRWDNMATACGHCNCWRGCNEAIQPRTKPYRPTYNDLIKNMRKFPINVPHPSWNWYLGWDDDKVNLVNRRKLRHPDDIFDLGLEFHLD